MPPQLAARVKSAGLRLFPVVVADWYVRYRGLAFSVPVGLVLLPRFVLMLPSDMCVVAG